MFLSGLIWTNFTNTLNISVFFWSSYSFLNNNKKLISIFVNLFEINTQKYYYITQGCGKKKKVEVFNLLWYDPLSLIPIVMT